MYLCRKNDRENLDFIKFAVENSNLSRPKPRQHSSDRLQNDKKIEPGREILDVVEIVVQLF